MKGKIMPMLKRHGTGCLQLTRSEEHTSELQSHSDIVCRLLLEKKKEKKKEKEKEKERIIGSLVIIYIICMNMKDTTNH